MAYNPDPWTSTKEESNLKLFIVISSCEIAKRLKFLSHSDTSPLPWSTVFNRSRALTQANVPHLCSHISDDALMVPCLENSLPSLLWTESFQNHHLKCIQVLRHHLEELHDTSFPLDLPHWGQWSPIFFELFLLAHTSHLCKWDCWCEMNTSWPIQLADYFMTLSSSLTHPSTHLFQTHTCDCPSCTKQVWHVCGIDSQQLLNTTPSNHQHPSFFIHLSSHTQHTLPWNNSTTLHTPLWGFCGLHTHRMVHW